MIIQKDGHRPQRRSPSIPAAVLYLMAAIVFWLAPFFYSGWTGRVWSLLPKSLSFQHSAAGLFARRSTVWWDQHIEIQGRDDARHELPERTVFPMGAFGYRTRYDRILMESNRSPLNSQVRQRLAAHIFNKLEQLVPREGDERSTVELPKAIRLVRTLWRVGSPDLANPQGEWNPPPVGQVTGISRALLGTYKIEAGKAVEVKAQIQPINAAASRTMPPSQAPGARLPAMTPKLPPGVTTVPRVIRSIPRRQAQQAGVQQVPAVPSHPVPGAAPSAIPVVRGAMGKTEPSLPAGQNAGAPAGGALKPEGPRNPGTQRP